MIRVMQNHAYSKPKKEMWLFLGVTWAPKQLDCDVHTLNTSGTAVVAL